MFYDKDGNIISEAGCLNEENSKMEIELAPSERIVGILSSHNKENWDSCHYDV